MKALHGGQATHDTIDAHQIATLRRGGMLHQAYVYPAEMRGTRDLLRRRTPLMRERSELLSHGQNTNSPYNLPDIGKQIADQSNRAGVAERFHDPAVQKTIEVDLALITYYDALLRDRELSAHVSLECFDRLRRHIWRISAGVLHCALPIASDVATYRCRDGLWTPRKART